LNGKPIELFTSLNWLDPQYWTGKKGFYARRYCNAHSTQFGWDDTGASNLDELNTLLRSKWMVRRLKKDVLKDLPAKVRQVIEIEADKKIQAVIAAELNKWEKYETALDTAEDEVVKAKMDDNQDAYEEAVAKLKAARRVAFEEMAQVRHATSVAKAPYVAEFIAETLDDKEGKIVVFAHHKDVVEILMNTLKEFHPVKVTGDVSAKNRDEAVSIFQNDSKCRVFVGNIQAAGVGLTLTAASHVIFAELDWVPANVTQAEDRCHRIGQLDSVLCQHIVLAGSLDAKMSRTIVSKQRIADQALDKKVAVTAPAELAPKVNGHTVTVPGKLTVTVPAQQQEAVIPIEKVQAAHQAMKMLAGICNGAVSLDEMGFNKLDTKFGKDLASRASLSQKQAKYAVMLARKYKRQLPTQILSVIGVEK
jgi:SWI/SNF-related matrix-associated actin-dependent regulator 1 of chromatin subfamily A